MGVGPLCDLYPRVFRVMSNKESIASDCYGVKDDCIVWCAL